uniref:Uncharacterized protein n=1 Tax=Oryza brachyantha TaxID=4533 RepID=J3L0D4_ORYBR
MHLDRPFLQMVDPTPGMHAPIFSGPPPERPENPMIRDPVFGKALPTPASCSALAAAMTSPALPKDRRPGEPCAMATLSLVWVEGFRCLDHDRRRRRIAASG